MIAAALTAQSSAGAYVSAAEEERMEADDVKTVEATADTEDEETEADDTELVNVTADMAVDETESGEDDTADAEADDAETDGTDVDDADTDDEDADDTDSDDTDSDDADADDMDPDDTDADSDDTDVDDTDTDSDDTEFDDTGLDDAEADYTGSDDTESVRMDEDESEETDTTELDMESSDTADTDKKETEETGDFSAGEGQEASAASMASFNKAYQTTGAHLAKMAAASTPKIGATEGEWEILGLARSGQEVDASVYSRYKSGIVDVVKENKGILHDKKYTEYSRVVLALTALGEDVTNVGGYNLLQPLSDFDQTVWQGVNGAIWALIAFDSKNYEIPKAEDGKTQNSREKLIEHILSMEVKGGGWSMSGAADTDVTAMAIQALAPYYKTNSAVKAAVDRGLKVLSGKQEADGGFGTWGTSTSESCSQVIVALSAMGIDANADKRFVKNGKSALQGLLGYFVSTGGFRHVKTAGYDQMATEQGYYALTAYSRFKNGENRLYDMTDVPVQSDYEKAREVIDAIDSLPSKVTLENMETVKTTYAAYNALNSAQKTLITKARKEKLTKAMASIETLEIQKTENLITAIGTVTLAKEDAIRAAKVSYYSLSSAQQKKVKNFSVLEAAEKELNRLKYQANKKPTPTPTQAPASKPGTGKNPGGKTHSVKTPTPKATATPTPEETKSTGKKAGGSTKSATIGNSKNKKSTKKTDTTNKTDPKNKTSKTSAKKDKNKKTSTSSKKAQPVKAEKTKASQAVLKEIRAFFKKEGNTYISKVEDFSESERDSILDVYRKYQKLSAGEKAAVQKDTVYKPYQKLLKDLGTRNHYDSSTGAQVSSEKSTDLPWYVQLKTHPEQATDKELETIKKALGDQVEVFSLNEIHFVDTLKDEEWQPKEILTVELPMVDLGDYESCMIVHITDAGKVEFLNGKVSEDTISFDAAEFSSYGIVGFMGSPDDLLKETDKKQPVWPWAAGAGAALLLVVILGVVRKVKK